MLFEIIKISIISLLLIFLLHYFYRFLLQNLTTPDVRDLVNKPKQNYEKIFNTINSSTSSETNNSKQNVENNNNNNYNKNQSSEPNNIAPNNIASTNMKNELQHFINKEINSDQTINFNSIERDNLEYSKF
jgi:cell shape-determining protein MreC